jgi:hypothetical protein
MRFAEPWMRPRPRAGFIPHRSSGQKAVHLVTNQASRSRCSKSKSGQISVQFVLDETAKRGYCLSFLMTMWARRSNTTPPD